MQRGLAGQGPGASAACMPSQATLQPHCAARVLWAPQINISMQPANNPSPCQQDDERPVRMHMYMLALQ